jgi:hexosaminidase
MKNLIPLPASVVPSNGTFLLTPEAILCLTPGSDEVSRVASALAEPLRRSTGYRLPIQTSTGNAPKGSIFLTITRLDTALGNEGYELRVEPERITLTALKPVGLYRGIQTIRQLLPAAVESAARQEGPWRAGIGIIRDQPRFGWRGLMLDVARHFFKVEEVKRMIDLMAFHKLNVLHLHLTDDQGWRLQINSWPNLTKIGGSSAIRGDTGGFYTQEQFRAIVDYARARYMTVIPEVDLPGHTNAALASYPELNASGRAPAVYTGNEVGFSSLALDKEITYKFVEAVLRELVALTPGPFLHIGADEAHSTPDADYRLFVERVQAIVQKLGKACIGWEEIGRGKLLPTSVAQYWVNGEWALKAAAQGNKIVMSPATKTYLDIKYNASTPLGLNWTGSYTEVQDAYDWDPETFLVDLPKGVVLGLEAPLWTETIANLADLEFMAFPRLCGLAEVGWTPAGKRNWSDFRQRLAAHGARLNALNVNYYPSYQVPWEASF